MQINMFCPLSICIQSETRKEEEGKNMADVILGIEWMTLRRCSNLCRLCTDKGLSQEICTSGEMSLINFLFICLNHSGPGPAKETVR